MWQSFVKVITNGGLCHKYRLNENFFVFFVCVRVCTRTDPDDLEESDSHGHNSDRKNILTSSPGTLTYGNINLGVFMTLVIHLPCENSILPNFSLRFEIENRLRVRAV